MADPATIAKAAAKAAQVVGRLASARGKRQQDDGGGGSGAGFALLLALVVMVPAGLVIGVVLLIATLFGAQQQSSCGGGEVGSVGGKGIPAKLIPIYQAAARQYHLGPLGPAVLASVNGIETDFGRNLSTSSAGAKGWMQFEPATWAQYGVDANHDGRRDPANPLDAIYAAANKLHADGAPSNWRGAVFAYNHAESYVADVLARAQQYAKGGKVPASTAPVTTADVTQGVAGAPDGSCGELAAPGGYVFPIPAGVHVTYERIDMGKDMQAPYGTPLLAIGDGIVTYNPGGFPCSIVLRLTGGPYRGRSIYYGHSGPHMFAAGRRVRAGQVLTHAHGNECGGESGHMELGWANGANAAAFYCAAETGGATCPHETPEGHSFYRFLLALQRNRYQGSTTPKRSGSPAR